MTKGKPIAIDLFAGCGGLTLGLRDAGLRVATTFEIDPIASRTYRRNSCKTLLLKRDIREASADELLRVAGKAVLTALQKHNATTKGYRQ